MIAAAVMLADAGFARIGWAAQSDGKGPVRHWQADAIDDPVLVPASLHGARNSLVIPKGRAVVIDVDEPTVWGDLETSGLPETLTIDSPTPGHGHVYGWARDDVDMASIGGTFDGGEVRRFDPRTATASMVLGPWARTGAGTYVPRGTVRTIAELPRSVIEYLQASQRRQEAEQAAARGPADPGWTISDGGRHVFLKRRARNLRGIGLSGERLLEEIVRLDQERCSPPIASLPAPRGMKELREIVAWTDRNIPDDPPPITIIPSSPSVNGREALEPIAELIGKPLAEFLAEDAGPVRWSVPGAIVGGGLAGFVGRPETFKTIGAMQLGLAGAAGGSWLGIDLGEPRPFVYLAAEKSRATVRDRLARMTRELAPVAPVRIVHRAGVTFGDRESWDRVRRVVDELGPRTFVVVDTIASLAGPGFDENSGRDMAVVLAALRALCDTGATVAALHHPSKYGEGTGGIRLRGHTSLWGEVDATLEFTRPDREAEGGMVRLEPKDGDLRLIAFRWDRETFLLEADTMARPLTATALAAIVDALYNDAGGLSAERIAAEFPGHGRSIIRERIGQAVAGGLIARVGRGPSTRYVPMPRVMRPDDRPDGPVSEGATNRGEWTLSSGQSSGYDAPSVHGSSAVVGNRPVIVHDRPNGENHRPRRGVYIPPADDSPEANDPDGAPSDAPCEPVGSVPDATAHPPPSPT